MNIANQKKVLIQVAELQWLIEEIRTITEETETCINSRYNRIVEALKDRHETAKEKTL